jgi:CheY-like chemotaxis protein
MLLRLHRHEVEVAHDGATAIDAARRFKPQVVLLDIGLPHMNGYEVARRLRALPDTERVLIIALSGYGRAEDRQRSKQAGFNEHLVKPAHPDQINALIANSQRDPLPTSY